MNSATFDYWRDQNPNQEVATMYYIGLDVASKSSFVYVIDGRGKKIDSEEILTKGYSWEVEMTIFTSAARY